MCQVSPKVFSRPSALKKKIAHWRGVVRPPPLPTHCPKHSSLPLSAHSRKSSHFPPKCSPGSKLCA